MRRSRTGEESNSLAESNVSWSCDDNDNDNENNINENIETRSLSTNYRKIKVLKRGSQGVVYLARDRNHSNNDNSSSSSSSFGGGGVVAVKRMFTDSREEALRGIPEGIIREIGILKQVKDFSRLENSNGNHDNNNNNNNIVRFHDVVFASRKNSSSNQTDEEICLVLEACTDGDISQLINSVADHHHHSSSPIPLDLILSIAYDCLKALDFLHNKMNCIHRDIKPSNVLLRRIHHHHHHDLLQHTASSQSMMEAVLSDFGSARKFDGENLAEERGDDDSHLHSPGARRTTLCYRPPEILLGARSYTTAVDIWGVAIVMIELFKGSHLFQTNSEMQMISQLFTVFGQPTSTTWPGSDEQFPLLKAFSFSQTPQEQEQEKEMREKSNKHLRAHLNHWKSQKRKDANDNDDDEAGKKKFDLFSDLLEKMTTLNPQARISARDALSHPCFSSNFSPDPSNFFSLWKRATTTTEGPGQQQMTMMGRNLGGAMQGSLPRPPPSVVGALKLQLGESESESEED